MKRGSKTWKILRNLLFNVFSVRLAAITEIGQTERETYCIISFICGILKKKQNLNSYKQSRLVVTRGE